MDLELESSIISGILISLKLFLLKDFLFNPEPIVSRYIYAKCLFIYELIINLTIWYTYASV